jgi:hypothetical protein
VSWRISACSPYTDQFNHLLVDRLLWRFLARYCEVKTHSALDFLCIETNLGDVVSVPKISAAPRVEQRFMQILRGSTYVIDAGW